VNYAPIPHAERAAERAMIRAGQRYMALRRSATATPAQVEAARVAAVAALKAYEATR
jgi:hypothetical protein